MLASAKFLLLSRQIILALALIFPLSVLVAERLPAGQPEKMLLWPDNADGSNGAPGAVGNAPGDRPELLLSLVKSQQPTAMIIVVPGGGYGGLAADHEGTQMAEWINSLGVSAAICLYRHRNSGGGYGYPYPIMDAQRAIRLARANAQHWNVNPEKIGIIGFSAGGHLTTSVSTTDTLPSGRMMDPVELLSSRPDFAIVCYPVIAFGESFTHLGSQHNLLGPNASPEQLKELSTQNRVTADTPPTFLWHTIEDQPVPVQNAIVYFQALTKHKVPCEMHIFEKGRHGLGLAKDTPGADQWPELCQAWLKTHKFLD
jgi:acetyl esterase/lipase